ncbi:hypothetical protein N7457_005304 [Penicillium paradoxum]|uniref:uncharacterized protein n=1 Tax=Penicillium paradoxum TaxID=176176 RepID=UPI002546B75D|nr:uncharacterized protein N7457_005304 [Penicillium paradoxum]KAJ5780144.1 hypothetical protein N7457_005304 [Penicillium paradoxum]
MAYGFPLSSSGLTMNFNGLNAFANPTLTRQCNQILISPSPVMEILKPSTRNTNASMMQIK